MAIPKGPGPKKNNKNVIPPSKVGSKAGQTVAAPGYKMGLVRNQNDTKNPTKTKTSGEGAKAVSVTTRAGIIAPKPVTPAAAAPAKKKGPSAVGKAISKAKNSIELAARKRVATSAYRGGGGGGRRGGGKTCAAYR